MTMDSGGGWRCTVAAVREGIGGQEGVHGDGALTRSTKRPTARRGEAGVDGNRSGRATAAADGGEDEGDGSGCPATIACSGKRMETRRSGWWRRLAPGRLQTPATSGGGGGSRGSSEEES